MKFLHSLWPARIGFSIIFLVEILGRIGVLNIEPEFTWKGMMIQLVSIWIGMEVIQKLINRQNLNLTIGPVGLIIMLQLAVDAMGDMGHLYDRFEWYDQVLHFSGGFAAALLATGFMRALHEKNRSKGISLGETLLVGFALSVVLGVLYEGLEYFEDVLTGSNRLGDGFDTVNDLLLGGFGALLGALLIVKLPKLTSKR